MSDNWPLHLCQVKGRGGYRCHLRATVLVMAQAPSLVKVERDQYIPSCRQHIAGAMEVYLARNAGWVSVVPVAKEI